MKFEDLVDQDALTTALENKWINIRYADDGQRVYNYSDLAMFDKGAWENSAVLQCRGLIVSPSEDVIARPFAKFFNHNQSEALPYDWDALVEVTEKQDGSLAVIHKNEAGNIRVATRGSFYSDQAVAATSWLKNYMKSDEGQYFTVPDHATLLFEWVGPDNRIVLSYPENELVLLGSVEIESGRYHGPIGTKMSTGWGGKTTEVFPYRTFREVISQPERSGVEGFCVRFLNDNKIVKIKTEEYVSLHKLVSGLSERSVWEHMVAGKPLSELICSLPDELHIWTKEVWMDLSSKASDLLLKTSLIHSDILSRVSENDRKTYAAEAMKHSDIRPYLFMQLDNNDPLPSIIKSLKPRGDTRAKVFKEDTA